MYLKRYRMRVFGTSIAKKFADCFSRIDRPGYQHYRSFKETIRQLTSHGDKLLREIIFPVAKLQTYNQRNTGLIRKKADKLAKQHPESADLFESYVRWEEDESYILETETIPATWLLQKNWRVIDIGISF